MLWRPSSNCGCGQCNGAVNKKQQCFPSSKHISQGSCKATHGAYIFMYCPVCIVYVFSGRRKFIWLVWSHRLRPQRAGMSHVAFGRRRRPAVCCVCMFSFCLLPSACGAGPTAGKCMLNSSLSHYISRELKTSSCHAIDTLRARHHCHNPTIGFRLGRVRVASILLEWFVHVNLSRASLHHCGSPSLAKCWCSFSPLYSGSID